MQPIPIEGFPTQFHTMDQVTVWQIRRVRANSSTEAEAAERLGRSKRWLWEWKKKNPEIEQSVGSQLDVKLHRRLRT